MAPLELLVACAPIAVELAPDAFALLPKADEFWPFAVLVAPIAVE